MSDQSALERAAKALTEHNDYEGPWEAWLGDARAVLMAIREPSEGMLDSFGIHKARMTQNYQAMIDAALEDSK